MNLDQFLGMARAALPFVLPTLVSNGIVPAGTEANLGSVAVLVASWGWTYIAHTTSAKVASVEALGAQKIVIPTNASAELKAIAADPARPQVVLETPFASSVASSMAAKS